MAITLAIERQRAIGTTKASVAEAPGMAADAMVRAMCGTQLLHTTVLALEADVAMATAVPG